MAAVPASIRMSAKQFSRAVNAGTRIAEAGLLDRMTTAYRLALVSIAGDASRRFEKYAIPTHGLTAAYVESEHPRDPGGEGGGEWIAKGASAAADGVATAKGNTVEEQLADMGAFDLEGGQERHPERYMKHPRSGYDVERPGVIYPEAMQPVLDPDGWGRQPPRVRDVVNGEGFGLPPGYTDADVKAGKITPIGYGKFQVGEPRPPKYLYRAVSEEEWQQARKQGFLKSDQRMNLSQQEGTVTALSNPSYYLPGALASDKPGRYEGRVIRIKYRGEDGWRHDRDGYVKTSKPIPIGRVDMTTSKLTRDVVVDEKGYNDTGPYAITAAGDERAKFVAPDPQVLVPRQQLAEEINRRTRKLREQAVHVAIGPTMHSVGIDFQQGGVFSDRILKQVGARIPDAAASTRDAIQTVIGRAQAEGMTVPETAAEIQRHIMSLSESTATQLARTDLIGTSNAAATAAAKILFAGEPVNKRWLATEDERTRPTHRDADGQVVPLEGRFSVGEARMDYPGDPTGPDEEVCNCRCTVLFEQAGEQAQRSGLEAYAAALHALDTIDRRSVAAGLIQGLRYVPTLGAVSRLNVTYLDLGRPAFLPGGIPNVKGILDDAGARIVRRLQQEPETPTHIIDLYHKLVVGDKTDDDPETQALIERIKAAARGIGFPAERLYRVLRSGAVEAVGAAARVVPAASQIDARKAVAEAVKVVEQVADVRPDVASRLVVQALAATIGTYADDVELIALPVRAAAVDYTSGSMVALYPDVDTAATLAVPNGQPPDDLHVTLAFLPDGVPGDPERLAQELAAIVAWTPPLEGTIGGLGMFQAGPDGVPVVALPDVPGLAELRVVLCSELSDMDVEVGHDHGFTPHITLTYAQGADSGELDADILGLPLRFDHVCLVVGPEKWELPLGGALVAAFDPSLHPHRPAGSDKGGEWAPTPNSQQLRARVGVTPFRPEDDPAGFYESDKFRTFERSIEPTAKRYGVTVDANDRTSGFWQGEQEPSVALDVHDGEAGVRGFAGNLRERWDQDAVLLFTPGDGDAVAYKLAADGDIPGALTAAGVDGATIYDGGVEIIGGPDDGDKVLDVARRLGVDPSQVQVRTGSLSFVER